MVRETLKKDLMNSKDKIITLFLDNSFRYECRVLEVEDDFVKIFDEVKKKEKWININQIAEVDLK